MNFHKIREQFHFYPFPIAGRWDFPVSSTRITKRLSTQGVDDAIFSFSWPVLYICVINNFLGLPARCGSSATGSTATESSAKAAASEPSASSRTADYCCGCEHGNNVLFAVYLVAMGTAVTLFAQSGADGGGPAQNVVAFEAVSSAMAIGASLELGELVFVGIYQRVSALVAKP